MAANGALWGLGIGAGLMRLSVGIEDCRDLVADVSAALARAANGAEYCQ